MTDTPNWALKANIPVLHNERAPGIALKASATPSAGVNELFDKDITVWSDCASATIVVLLRGVQLTMGDNNFDAAAQTPAALNGDATFTICGFHNLLSNYYAQKPKNPAVKFDLIPGDIRSIIVPDGPPGWQVENVVYLGKDEYFANLPAGPKILDKKSLLDAINAASGSPGKTAADAGISVRPKLPSS